MKRATKCYVFLKSGNSIKVISFLLLLLFAHQGWAQSIKITGSVKDAETNEPLPGASVLIKGTTTGVVADFDGKYEIIVPSKKSILRFSFVSFLTQEIVVGEKTNINVTLQPDSQALDEIVVVGYGTRKKANLTGAVQTISAKELENRVVVDPLKALQGALPGLNITYGNGRPNELADINIRGFESLSGGAPLIVIDGIPSDIRQFTELNPSDIESVTTLMDAASSAIYGARASFGVVLVTTKSAKKGKLSVSFDTNTSYRNALHVPEYILDPYTVQENRVTGAGGWYDLRSVWGNSSWDLLRKLSDEGTEVIVNPDNTNRYLYAGRTEWYKEAINKNAASTIYNLSLSGSNDKVSYFMSGGVSSTDGAFKYGKDTFDKYNLRTKLDFKASDWLTISNNSSFVLDEYDEPSQGFNFNGLRNQPTTDVIRNPDGSWTQSGASIFGRSSEGGRATTSNSRFSTFFTVKGSFWEDLLTVTARASYMKRDRMYGRYSLPVSYNNGPNSGGVLGALTVARREAIQTVQNVYDVFADLKKSFGNHNLHLLVGYNQEYRSQVRFFAERRDLISTSVPSLELATGDRDVEEEIWDWATRSGFGRFLYDYKGKYLLELNGRYDGTSRFSKNDRFGFFPSVSIAWNIAKEDFFKDIAGEYISSLKPRFSYGSLGNQDVDSYAYLASMSSRETTTIIGGNQQTTLLSPGLVSGSLTWETVRSTNFGLDFGFFNNRLTGIANYYERETLDMLTKSKQLPGVLGTSEPQQNAADLVTKGWDFSLRWRDGFEMKGSRFNYNFGVVLADSRSWITEFDNPNGNLNDYYVGYEIGTIFGFESDGLFQSEEEIANHANQSNYWSYPDKTPPAPGDIKFKDLNGDGVIRGALTINDLQDERIIGNRRSRYTIGVNYGANWKGFDFSMFWQGVLKRDWYPGGLDFWGLRTSPWSNLQKYNHNNTWTPETPDAYLPRVKGYAASNFSGAEILQENTRYLQNAWYMRLKNVTVGYTLPENFNKKMGIDRLRLYLSGENLATFTGLKNPNIDPETLNTGYPMQSLFAFGLNLNF
ncbi:TonB-dependent receptor [Polaribacter batillariae]|uniref:TonB-dependent receptor n=1 Tax=Polaribacter batillariae TaxID=2808900 RepID=A0ABX7SUF4_9FLAO|nr:TonB-dependent receptor [Polaribacter batillariae]QTD37294.1 TonB-dependent receptor [Polaribacter batillariae]